MANTSQAKSDSPFEHLLKQHPCFNGEAHATNGRIHLPVSPVCNIQCRFCQRGFNKVENRPGVSRRILTPQEAVETVERALKLCPEIKVAGIAGPGDTLATDHAIEAFRLIHERFPQLINCLSTNGLLLAEKAGRLLTAGVRTVTVTVNAVEPAILQQICSHVYVDGIAITGEFAARTLINAQLAGIREAARLKLTVKINMVLIPGVNVGHVEEVARTCAAAGATLINLIPLIPQHQLAEHQVPTCRELESARAEAERHLTVFRHCRQCRADACGIPGGKDVAEQLYEGPMAETTFSHG